MNIGSLLPRHGPAGDNPEMRYRLRTLLILAILGGFFAGGFIGSIAGVVAARAGAFDKPPPVLPDHKQEEWMLALQDAATKSGAAFDNASRQVTGVLVCVAVGCVVGLLAAFVSYRTLWADEPNRFRD